MGNKKKQKQHRKEKQIRDDDQIEQQNKQKQQKSDEQTHQKQQENKKQTEKKFEILPPKKVQYCPACSLPFQLCKFGKNVNACIKFLYDLAPAKVTKYHPDFKQQDITLIKKQMKEAKKQQAAKQQKQKKQKSVKDKYIVVDTKNRGKKKYVSTITGLNIFSIDAKQFSKKLSKKFACSCSAIQQGVAQVQGEFFEQIKEILIMQYKVKKKYILDGEEYKVKFNQEMQKKKEMKKNKDNAIAEDPNQDVEDKQVEKKIEQKEQKKEGEQLPKVEEKPKNRLGFEIRSDSEDDD